MNPKFILFIGLLVTFVIEQRGNAEMACSTNWSVYGTQCYKVFYGEGKLVNQSYGIDKCHAEKAELVSIHSMDENKFVEGLVKAVVPKFVSNKFWIGLKITRNSATSEMINCNWLDASPMNFGNVNHFDAGTPPWGNFGSHGPAEPNNNAGKEDCVVFHVNRILSGWDDRSCDENEKLDGYICKK